MLPVTGKLGSEELGRRGLNVASVEHLQGIQARAESAELARSGRGAGAELARSGETRVRCGVFGVSVL